MATDPGQARLLHGTVEMYECCVGGKPRKGNRRNDDEPNKPGRGTSRMPVLGIVEGKQPSDRESVCSGSAS